MSPEEKAPKKRSTKKEPTTSKVRTGKKATTPDDPKAVAAVEALKRIQKRHLDMETEQTTPPEQGVSGDVGALQVVSHDGVPPAGNDLIERAVTFINEKANETLYRGSVEIGAFVLKHFFNDDIELATSRNPKKPASYSALCQRQDLFVKPEALGVMVRVAAQEKFFADNGVDTEGLSYSHKAELAKLENGKPKLLVVKRSLEHSWSVRRLNEFVSKHRKRPAPERGLLGTYLVKRILSPQELFDDPRREGLFHDDERRKEYLKSLKEKTRRTLSEKVGEAVEKARGWVAMYEQMIKDLQEIELEKEPKKS